MAIHGTPTPTTTRSSQTGFEDPPELDFSSLPHSMYAVVYFLHAFKIYHGNAKF